MQSAVCFLLSGEGSAWT